MKKEKFLNALPYIFVFTILFLIHLSINFSNDDLWFAKQLNKFSYIGYVINRYNTWSSRLIIETLLITLTRNNIIIWKILDILIFLLGISLSIYFVNKKKYNFIKITGCLLFLLYPLLDMSSAGWVSTTLNYLWCFSLGLLSFIPIIKFERKEKIGKIIYIISTLGLIYATNQEQMCAIIFGLNFVYILHNIINKRKLSRYSIICLIVSAIGLLFILTCPGNENRTLNEISTWYPEFKKYGILQKTFLGVISTFDILLSNKAILLIFVTFLSYGCFIYSKRKISKIISLFNFITVLANTIFFSNFINLFPSVQKIYSILNYHGISNYPLKYSFITFSLCILFLINMIYMLYVIFHKKDLLPIFIFLAGFCSRFIIGFSPTIYASGSRTAFFMYMSLIIVLLIIIYKLYDEKKINNNNKILIISVLMFFSIYNYLNIFMSL